MVSVTTSSDGERLTVLVHSGGRYEECACSRCFPWLPMAAFAAWLDRSGELDETSWMRAFRDWVVQNVRAR